MKNKIKQIKEILLGESISNCKTILQKVEAAINNQELDYIFKAREEKFKI